MPTTTNTQYFLKLAPIPPNFAGTPQEFAEVLVDHCRIVAPFGITTFLLGGSKPTNNQGPWLKDGKQWWVWDDDATDYLPLDITGSEKLWFVIQASAPLEFDIPLWVEVDVNDQFVNFHVRVEADDGSFSWAPFRNQSGTTANRPATPYTFQRFYDTDIEAEIWWERGGWRTTSGVRGDVKFVSWPTSVEALTRNPGWEILGTGESNAVDWRGRVLSQATKDTVPGEDLDVTLGFTKRASGDRFGEETHKLTPAEIPELTASFKNSTKEGSIGANKWTVPTNDDWGFVGDTSGVSPPIDVAGDRISVNDGVTAAGHNTLQPTLALWCLRKT